MKKKNSVAGILLLVVSSLLIAACGSQPQAVPTTTTVDANMIYTQAAETVQAGINQTQAAQPTTAATATIAPTNTLDPAAAAAFTATANAVLNPVKTTPAATNAAGTPAAGKTPGVTAAPTTLATAVKLATATSAVVAPPASKGDKAELVDQSPKDGTSLPKAASFDMTFVLKNTGTTTWTTDYKLVFYAGERLGSPADFNMPNEVKPGGIVRLVFTLTAPDNKADTVTQWAVRNADGTNFYPIYLKLSVTD